MGLCVFEFEQGFAEFRCVCRTKGVGVTRMVWVWVERSDEEAFRDVTSSRVYVISD